jgi:hypothetical protein
MAMPSGDTPQKAQAYYHYLQGRQLEPHGRVSTWHVDWTSLAWEWGFVLVLAAGIVFWIREYRSTHPETGITPLDRWGGFTTEAAGRVPLFFWWFLLVIVGFGAEFVISHLVNGQLF